MTAIWPRIWINTGHSGLVLDTGVLGTDALAADPDYDEVPAADVRAVSIRRGGERFRYDTGELIVTLDNRRGDYDPNDRSGAYGDRLRPGMLGKASIRTYDYYETDAFVGRLAEVQVNPDPVAPTVTWVFEDALSDLGRSRVTAPAGAVDTSNVIASDLLDEAHQAVSGVAASGRSVRRPSNVSTREALDRVAMANAGRFYIAADGTPTLKWRAQEASKSPVLTLNADQTSPWYRDARLSPGFGQVLNTAIVRRDITTDDGGESQVEVSASNGSSVVEFGARQATFDTATGVDGDAEELAQFLADYYSQPAPVVDEVVCYPQGWGSYDPAVASALELGDLVVVNLPAGGSYRGTVERIAWNFGAAVELRLGLDRYDPAGFGNADWFVIGTSALDGTALLAAF